MDLIISSNIKKIAIKNEDGELITELRIDVADGNTLKKFTNAISKLETIQDDVERKQKELEEKYKDRDAFGNELDKEQIVEISEIEKNYINSIISELDYVFGRDTIRNIYKESYELNEDFYPDEMALVDLVDKLIPLMSELFNQRFSTLKKQYSANRKGGKK